LFSWSAVDRFQEQLCPAPWRVPTSNDFFALDKALEKEAKKMIMEMASNGAQIQEMSRVDRYIKIWGGAYEGYCSSNGLLLDQGSSANYWSQSDSHKYSIGFMFPKDYYYGDYLYFGSIGFVFPQNYTYKSFGHSLRCVR